jgi:prepilin-type N-terminal cleavage/methylation domain-containing protein/prepilin-type processing-associated H-X9-DG protein
MKAMQKRYGGFTLIELLVVVAIISLLASILFPVFARARENARRASCMSNLKQIGLGMMMYQQDYDEHMMAWTYALPLDAQGWSGYPSHNTSFMWYHAIYPYVKNWQVFNCPSEDKAQYFTGSYNSLMGYGFNYKSPTGGHLCFSNCGIDIGLASLAAIEEPAETLVIVDSASQALYANSGASGKWPTLAEMQTDSDCTYSRLDCVRVRHFDTVNVLFMDGHVKSLPWQKLVSPAGLHYWTTTSNPNPLIP